MGESSTGLRVKMRFAPFLFVLPLILGLGLTLRITDFINQFSNENSNQRQLAELPADTEQILPVFATAFLATVINSLLFSATTKKEEEFHWCYGDSSCNEEAWKDHYPICNGIRQSPINVEFAATTASDTHSNGALMFGGYDQVRVGVFANTVEHNTRSTSSGGDGVTDNDLTNNGHTAQLDVNMPSASAGVLSGGPLSEDYQVLQLHFHWGKTNDRGSEHTYDGRAFPLEMHIVHVKSSLKGVEGDPALKIIDGLAVTGFVFSIGSENAALKPLTDALSQITSSGGKINFANTGFKLNNLIDPVITANNARYSTYDGGLTTPGCFEVVKWINFKTPLEISSAQLAQFRTLMDGKGKMIYDNFRSPQPLNGRTVEHYTVV